MVHNEIGALVSVNIAGLRHDNGLHHAVINPVARWQIRHRQVLPLRRTGGDRGEGSHALAVSGLHGELIFRAVGQARDGGAGRAQVAAELGELRLPGHAVERLIERGVLGLAPAQAQCPVHGHHPDVGGCAGHLGGLGHGGDNGRRPAAPSAVGGCYLEIVGGQILQPRDRRLVAHHRQGPVQVIRAFAVGHLVAGDVAHRAPGEFHHAVPRLGGEVHHLVVRLGVLRHDVLEEFDLGHCGILRLGAGLPGHTGHMDGDLLHRHPAAQVDGHHPLPGGRADGVDPGGGADVKGDVKRAPVLRLHRGSAGLQGSHAVRAGDLDALHLHRRRQFDGEHQIVPRRCGRNGDGFRAGKELLRSAGAEDEARRLHHGDGDGPGLQDLRRSVLIQNVVDIGEVRHVHRAVSVEVAALRCAAQAGLQICKVLLVQNAVAVDVAQGEGAVPGAGDDVAGVAVQGDVSGVGHVARAGHLQPVSPLGQTGDLRLVVPQPGLGGHLHAVDVLRLHRHRGLEVVAYRRACGKGELQPLRAPREGQLDAAPFHRRAGLGQVKADGQADRARGPRPRRTGRLRPRGEEGERHGKAQKSRRQSFSPVQI